MTLNYNDLLDRLLALGDSARDSGYEMAGQDMRASLFIIGWFQRIRRTARAVRVLIESGFAHEAAPLTRTMVEYGVAMKLITREPYKGVDIYVLKMQKTIGDWTKVAAESGGSTQLSPEMESILEWQTEPDSKSLSKLLAFKHLCEEVDELDFYWYWWKILPFCHASYEGSMCYVSEMDHQLLDEAIDGNVVDPLRVATVVLFMACDAVHAFMPAEPWQKELDAVRAELDLEVST